MATNKKLTLNPVDELGGLRAQIAPLNARIEELEGELKRRGDGAYEGVLYRVTVSTYDATIVAWKDIATKMGASQQMITGNSRPIVKCKICVVARSTEKKVA